MFKKLAAFAAAGILAVSVLTGCGIGDVSIEKVTPKLIPYFIILFAMLLLVTYVPALSLGVPSLMGLIKQKRT